MRNAVWPANHPRDFIYLASLRDRELLRVKMPSFAEHDRRTAREHLRVVLAGNARFSPLATYAVRDLATKLTI